MAVVKHIGKLMDAHHFWSRMLLVGVYSVVYDFIFVDFVVALFSYIGVDYVPLDAFSGLIWFTLSVFPMLFYRGIKRPSDYLNIFLYIFVYIPFVHATSVMYGIGAMERMLYNGVMCGLFSLYFLSSKLPRLFRKMKTAPLLPVRWIEVVTLALTLLLIAVNIKNMHFVNIFTQSDLMYELRAEISEEGAGGVFDYIKGWLYGAFYPFLLVGYLKNRRWVKSAGVLAAYFAMFMMDMQKMTFLLPFFLILLYFTIHRFSQRIRSRLHAFLLLVLVILSCVFLAFEDDKIVFALASILILRTICVGGWLTEFYLTFFQDHPYTYFSHVNIVNAFTHAYPYNDALGRVVANGTMNANANFFLTDGVAAWGVMGLLIIGVIYYLFFNLLDAISYRYDTADMMVIITPMVSYLLNVSLFTTILSSGSFLLFYFLMGTSNPLTQKQEEATTHDDMLKE